MGSGFYEASPGFWHNQPTRQQTVSGRDGAVSACAAAPVGIAARVVLRLVAHATGCETGKLTAASRGTSAEARARQLAIYLIHTSLSVSYNDIALLFGRDRTTIAHACRTIEDLRDVPAYDDWVSGLEETIELMTAMAVTNTLSVVDTASGEAA
ncbi:MAG: helix-turn-helix domain-containing protein [Nitratireductor sp.]